ncbi:MAG: hypothetical protein QCI00_01220 [Candidatus Thermoplasmatota archaeon]|nr:hypothetical protein [Candidatus Thermoplasmatota archaeon]
MTKKTITYGTVILVLSIMLVSSSTVSVVASNEVKSDSALFRGKTFLMGTILNPVNEEGVWTAQALQLTYYEPGILFQRGGVVGGLATVTFADGFFIHVWSPGPFGLIAYVFGITSEFKIIS